MFGFGKKKGGRNPSERIQSLSRQGMTEPDIISEMRGEGYKPKDVDRGFRDVLKRAAVPETPRPTPQQINNDWTQARPDLSLPPLPGQRQRVFKEDEYAPGPAPSVMPGLPPMPARPQSFGGGEQMEPEDLKEDEEFMDIDDLDEEPQRTPRMNRGVPPSPGMVDGRLDRLDNDMEELQERIERIEGRLHSTEQRLPSTDFEKRETDALKQAADAQSKALGEVTMRMEALEKVLKDSLTPMMQTMRSLSDTIKSLKGQREM